MLSKQITTPTNVVETKQTSTLTVTIVTIQKALYIYSLHVREYKTYGNTSNQFTVN